MSMMVLLILERGIGELLTRVATLREREREREKDFIRKPCP